MKRSEMVELMVNELANDLNYERIPLIVASELLAKMERVGMEPPSLSLPTKAIFKNREINVGNITTVRVWEPEDETGEAVKEN